MGGQSEYSDGRACKICSKPMHNGTRTGRCKRHLSAKRFPETPVERRPERYGINVENPAPFSTAVTTVARVSLSGPPPWQQDVGGVMDAGVAADDGQGGD